MGYRETTKGKCRGTLERPTDADSHHRRSIRLKGYDHTQHGAYFVTICIQDRLCLFGKVADGKMRLNDAGRTVQDAWNDLPHRYRGVDINAFIVTPNHVHGIIILVGAGPRACPDFGQPLWLPLRTYHPQRRIPEPHSANSSF